MTNAVELAVGAKLAERHDRLEADLLEAQVFEATNPDAAMGTCSSANIQEALDRLEARDEYQAWLKAEKKRLKEVGEG